MRKTFIIIIILLLIANSKLIFAGINEDLIKYAQSGKLENIKQTLKEGADINAKDKYNDTPLHLIMQKKYNKNVHQVVFLLLQKGADVNKKNDSGRTPLHYTSSVKLAKLLLKYRADINSQNNNGETPLHNAVTRNKKNLIQYLIANGANLNIKDKNMNTPLWTALMEKKHSIAYILINKGADISPASCRSPIAYAIYRNDIKLLKLLIERGADINFVDCNGASFLHFIKNNIGIAQLLIDKNIDCTMKASNGETPLHIALEGGHHEMAQLLINNLSKVNIKNSKNETPLHILARGGELDYRSEYDCTEGRDIFLTTAIKLTKALLNKEAAVNLIDNQGMTPLHYSTKMGFVELSELLIKYGADINKRNKQGIKPFPVAQIAARSGLRLRDKPILTGKIISVIPYGEKIFIESKDGPEEKIEGIKAKWNKIIWNTKKGWAFSGFIKNKITKTNINLNKKQKIVRVKDVIEFIKSIAPNKKIILENNIYNLSRVKNIKNRYIKWVKGELFINSIYNFSIQSSNDVEVVTDNISAYVINFNNCRNLKIDNINFGHSSDNYCDGGVLKFTNSNNIKINKSILYGSGTIGINLYNVKNFTCTNSVIRDCSIGLLKILKTSSCLFKKTIFKDTYGYDLIKIKGSDQIKFLNCIFKNNRANQMNNRTDFLNIDILSSNILIKNSNFTNNYAYAFIKNKNILDITDNSILKNNQSPKEKNKKYNIIFKNNKFNKNIFLEKINSLNANNFLFYLIKTNLPNGISIALNNGAETNSKNSKGQTPLSSAIYNNKQHIAGILIEKEADIDAVDKAGYTPLMIAIKVGNSDLVSKLINLGSDIQIKDKSGNTAIDHILQNKSKQAISQNLYKILKTYPDLFTDKKYLNRLLMLAAQNGHIGFINHFIQKGLNINKQYQEGNTLLHSAAKSRHDNSNIIYQLIKWGAKITIKNNDNKTPFDIGEKTARQILYHKTPLDEKELILTIKNIPNQSKYERDKLKKTKEKIKNLISKGTDINFTDPWGWTPLHTAADIGSLEIMKILIKNGANINQKSKHKLYGNGMILYHYPKGVTPLDIALIRNHKTIINFLKKVKPINFKKGNLIVTNSTASFYDQKKKQYYYLPYGTKCIILNVFKKKLRIRLQKNKKITGFLYKSDVSKNPLKKTYQDRLIIKTIKQKFYNPDSVAESFLLHCDFSPDGCNPGDQNETDRYKLYLRCGLERLIYWSSHVPIRIKHFYQWLLRKSKIPAKILNSSKCSKISPKIYTKSVHEYYIVKKNKDDNNRSFKSWNTRLKQFPIGRSSFFKRLPQSFHVGIGIIKKNKLFLYSRGDSVTKDPVPDAYHYRFNFIYLLQTYFKKVNTFKYMRKNKKLYYRSKTPINFITTDLDGSDVKLLKGTIELELTRRKDIAINLTTNPFSDKKIVIVYLAPGNIIKKLNRYKNYKLIKKDRDRDLFYDFNNDSRIDFIECISNADDMITDRINLFNIKGKWVPLLEFRTHDVP